MKVNIKSVNALMRAYDEGYEKGKADERKRILDILKLFINGDYNSKECKLMVSELVMWEGEQKE